MMIARSSDPFKNLAVVMTFVIVAVQLWYSTTSPSLLEEPYWQYGDVGSSSLGYVSPYKTAPVENQGSGSGSLEISNVVPYPKLSQFLVDGVPTNDTKLLLDFVVAGFAKCGTTTLGSWLGGHPEIKMPPGERYDYARKINMFVKFLYLTLPKGNDQRDPFAVKKGFRSPHFIQAPRVNRLLQQYFPRTKLILSVRHPVLWFESYYNYRLESNEFSILKGTPNELIGELQCSGCHNPYVLSTAKGRFHRYIARLHKTPLSDETEMDLLGAPFRLEMPRLETLTHVANPVFFLETSQLGDKNQTRTKQLRRDLQRFLGLNTEFPETEIPKVRPVSNAVKNKTNTTMIDICQEEYLPVREELMYIARNASIWFQTFFMASEEVVVSSRNYLVAILEGWMRDPCQGRVGPS